MKNIILNVNILFVLFYNLYKKKICNNLQYTNFKFIRISRIKWPVFIHIQHYRKYWKCRTFEQFM